MLKIAWSRIYNHPLPQGHRFPMEKYELLPAQLLHEGIVTQEQFFEPRKLTEEEILAVHDAEYWRKLQNLELSRSEERQSGFPISHELVDREVTINGGTIQCAEFALKYGVAMNIAGGTHHAFTNRAEGFCLLNDQAIAARYLLNHKLASRILIVDLDVHQGNGTAEIFRNEDRVFTFSMHGEKNYPHRKEKSDLDIELPDHTDDKTYLNLLSSNLEKVLDRFQPDFMFYQAGVDVLSSDKLGRLAVSIEGCAARDRIVMERAHGHSIPVVITMGGGYSAEIKTILRAHQNTFQIASEILA